MNEKQHILIVDDNLKNLQITAKLLKEKGFAISLAQSGEQAIALLEHEVPDLILLDVMMPEIDGYETCRRIKQEEKWKETPVIFLTAKNQTEDLVEGFDAGGVDYITKPFNSQELLVRVSNHLELTESKKRIVALNNQRDKLYSIIAHDVRSPLAGIILMLDVVLDGTIEPTDADFPTILNELKGTTESTLSLLNDLLNWTNSKVQGGAMNPVPLDVNLLITDCLSLLKSVAKDKNIKITTHLSAQKNVFADEVAIHTIFRNLVTNALKFTPEKGKINISTTDNNSYVEIKFQDTGIGMTEEVMEKLFKKEEHHTTYGTNYEKGTGLGIPMVQEFTRKNKGEFKVESTEGKGTTITVQFPILKSYDATKT